MAGEWTHTTIGEEVTLQRGIDITKAAQRAGTVPVISSGGVSSYHDTPAAQGPGVLLGRKGVVGSVYFVASDYWPHDTTLWVKDFHGNVPRFVYYFFLWMAPRIARMDVGSANPTLNRNHVHPIETRWPPLPEQRAIAHILGTLDDKIELNRRMNETLEAMARALFKSWFVDFDPVRMKAEGRRTKAEKRPAANPLHPSSFTLPPSLLDLFPDSFEDSELGEIPKGWGVGTLADYAALNSESYSKSTYPETVQYVDLANTKWGRIESVARYDRSDAPSRAQRILRPGDTIVGTVRPGNGSYAFIAESGLTGSTGFAVLRPKHEGNAEFVYIAATAPENIERLARLADGGAYPSVRPDVVLDSGVVSPSREIVDCFAGITKCIMSGMAHNEQESRTLSALRDTLLPKLISGELRVKDAERVAEAGHVGKRE